MLSEGRPGLDNVYSLKEGTITIVSCTTGVRSLTLELGILTLHLDKESYERAGLVGKPEGLKGERGTKPRWGMSWVWILGDKH